MPPPRNSSPGAAKKKKEKAKQDQAPANVTATDASLQDWSSLMQKQKKGKQSDDAAAGQGGNATGPGSPKKNFVSLLDANALKAMKGKGKGKGKGGLLGSGGKEDINENACAVCSVTEGSVYPPYPRCEISIAALAAIAHYHLTKPKKVEKKKRAGSPKTKKPNEPSSPTKAGASPRNKSPKSSFENAVPDDKSTKIDDQQQRNDDLNATSLDMAIAEASIAAVPQEEIEEMEKLAEEAQGRSSTAHVMYCLTCRCLYDDDQHSWMPHKMCERCLYCTHGYRDVRTLDLSPGAPTVCKDGLPVPQSYADIRSQADQGVHWIMPLHESDVLQGRPLLLPPEARDFKSAMNRARPKDRGDGGDGDIGGSQHQVDDAISSSAIAKEFVYEEALENAVCDIVVHSEETRRKALVGRIERHLIEEKLETTENFGVSFLTLASRYYSSQIFLILEKFKQEAKKIRQVWLDKVNKEIEETRQRSEEFYVDSAQERDKEFDDIWMHIQMSRGSMMAKYPNKEFFLAIHSEAMARTDILNEHRSILQKMWLDEINTPQFAEDSAKFQRDAIQSVLEMQKEIWRDMNICRTEIGALKLFDEFGFRQIVTYGTIARLMMIVEAEGDKIYEREYREKSARIDLRYYFMKGKLAAIESEKRRSYTNQRLNFLHMMLTVQEGEERQANGQRYAKEFSQTLSKLKKQAKSEGLFPDPKQKELDEVGLAMSPSKSSSLFDKKGKLIIPNIPYKKPPAPVPASQSFINDIYASLGRAFSGVDDVFITDDGRVGLTTFKEDPEGYALAKDRVSASFFQSESRDKKVGVSMMKNSASTRQLPHGVTYFDPADPPPESLNPDKIREAAANQIKKMKGRRRGGGKTQDYNATSVATEPPTTISALEFIGEVGTSIGQLRHVGLAVLAAIQNKKESKKMSKFKEAAKQAAKITATTTSDTSHPNPVGEGNSPPLQQQQDDTAEKKEGALEEDEKDQNANEPQQQQHAENENQNDDDQQQQQQQPSTQKDRESPLQKEMSASINPSNNNNKPAASSSPALSNASFRSPKDTADLSAAGSFALSRTFNALSANAFNNNTLNSPSGSLLPHQRLDFVDRSILSSNAFGRPVTSLFDDESNFLYFMNSVKREETAYAKALAETQEMMKIAMERICVPPPPRHKRERKPAWVEQRAAEIFKAAEVPPLPPPPPPPPKPKPKPKGKGGDANASSRGGRAASKDAASGDELDENGKRKRKVKFTDEDGLEFPEGQDGANNDNKAKPRPKRTAPKADPALLAAMSASQSQREMMRAMSMAAASGEDGADMEGAAFASGYHDDGSGDGAGSAFSLLLTSSLGSKGGKKSGGKRSSSSGGNKKKPGRHYEFM